MQSWAQARGARLPFAHQRLQREKTGVGGRGGGGVYVAEVMPARSGLVVLPLERMGTQTRAELVPVPKKAIHASTPRTARLSFSCSRGGRREASSGTRKE